MNSNKLNVFMEKMQKLQNILSAIIPINKITKHPFDYFEDKFNSILYHIDRIILESEKEKNVLLQETKSLKKKYYSMLDSLEIKHMEIPLFDNLYIEKEYVLNEISRITSEYRLICQNIRICNSNIVEIFDSLGIFEKKNLRTEKEINLNEINVSKIQDQKSKHRAENSVREVMWKLSRTYTEDEPLLEENILEFETFDKESLYNRLKEEDKFINFIAYTCLLILEDKVSKARLKKLQTCHKVALMKKEEKESIRHELFSQISSLIKKMNIKDEKVSLEQKIYVLEDLLKKYSLEIKEKEEELNLLTKEIRKKEYLLDYTNDIENSEHLKNQISCCNERENYKYDGNLQKYLKGCENEYKDITYNVSNIKKIREYLSYLNKEYELRVLEIYTRTRKYLEDLCELFTLNMDEYPKNDEGIEQMRIKIEELEPKKKLYINISSLIEKRNKLIESMNAFESIASNPSRLFQSSFQLVREEKFRSNAIPNLIKLEENIFSLLRDYKKEFGDFVINDLKYEDCLKKEIECRIINKSVFINKYDSPIRKRKN